MLRDDRCRRQQSDMADVFIVRDLMAFLNPDHLMKRGFMVSSYEAKKNELS